MDARTTFLVLEVTSQVATPAAESVVYDCVVFGLNSGSLGLGSGSSSLLL